MVAMAINMAPAAVLASKVWEIGAPFCIPLRLGGCYSQFIADSAGTDNRLLPSTPNRESDSGDNTRNNTAATSGGLALRHFPA
jgi:hypothetical protein